ncbi:exported hypothetical protein [Gammaproteobacteria bacterium]
MKKLASPYGTPSQLALAVALALTGQGVRAAVDCSVTQSTDDGTGTTANSLSWAIKTANTDVVAASGHPGGGCTNNTITLKTDVTITGPMTRLIDSSLRLTSDSNTTKRTLSGGSAWRPLFVKSGTVTLQDLILSNGMAKGGNSYNGGAGAGLGGALFLYGGALTILNVDFTNNTAQGGTITGSRNGGAGMVGNGGDAWGGGLFANGDDTSISAGYGGSGNYGGGNGKFGGGGSGGGAGGFGGGGARNATTSTGGAGGFGSGGGYGVQTGGAGGLGGGGGRGSSTAGGAGGYGGGKGNSVKGGGGAAFGGAIFVKNGTLSLQGEVTFSSNSAIRGTGGANNGSGKGGAIFVCTSDLDASCGGKIDETNSCGVSFSGGVAAQGQTDLFWTGASGGAHSTAGIADTTGCPSVVSIAPTNTPASTVTSMTFTVTFNQALSGVNASDFNLTATGTASGTIGTPTSSDDGKTWIVPVTGISYSTSGTLRLDLNAGDKGIVSTATGSALLAGYTSGTTHTVDFTSLGCLVTSSTDDGTGDTSNTLSWAIKIANGNSVAYSGHPGGGCKNNLITLTTSVKMTGVMKRLIDSNLTLQSDPGTSSQQSINGDKKYRPLFVKSGTVTIKNLILMKGLAQGGTGGYGGAGAGLGGALFVYNGTVTVQNVSFSGNYAVGGGLDTASHINSGGGLFGSGTGFDEKGFGGSGGGLFASGTPSQSSYFDVPGAGITGGYGGTKNYGSGTSGFGVGGTYNRTVDADSGGFGGGGASGGTKNDIDWGCLARHGGEGGFGGGGGTAGTGLKSCQYWNDNSGSGGFGGGGAAGGTNGDTPGSSASPGGYGAGGNNLSVGGRGAGFGGAIFVKRGTLALQTVVFSNNKAIASTGNEGTNGLAKGGGDLHLHERPGQRQQRQGCERRL